MKRLLSSLAIVGILAAVPHHAAGAQATDSTKKAAATARKAAKREEKKEKEDKKDKEAHPRLAAAMKRLEEAKKELEAAPNDFGGHKAESIKSIDAAMMHLKLAQAADKK